MLLTSAKQYIVSIAKLLMTFAVMVSVASAEQSLYLLTGTLSSSQADFPVRLYRVDSSTGAIDLVKDIAQGMSCVLADYVGRRLVIASPTYSPNEFYFVDMNAPDSIVARSVGPYASDTLPGQIYLLELPGSGPGIGFGVDKLDIKVGRKVYASTLSFVSLKPGGPTSLSFDSLRYLRVAGEVGGALPMVKNRVILRGDPLQVAVGGAARPDGMPVIGFPRPPYLKGRDANNGFQLLVNDDDRAVMLPAEPGVVDVLNKKSEDWRRVPIPFQGALIRGFGRWLGMIETRSSGVARPVGQSTVKREDVRIAHESPGAEKRRTEEIFPPYRLSPAGTVDDLFRTMHESGTFFPGELAVVNLDTGVQMKMSTGVGDSEIVLVTDDAVYYRVDDALYRRQIAGASLGGAVKLAEGPEIVQVHWAFLN